MDFKDAGVRPPRELLSSSVGSRVSSSPTAAGSFLVLAPCRSAWAGASSCRFGESPACAQTSSSARRRTRETASRAPSGVPAARSLGPSRCERSCRPTPTARICSGA
eukprot:scaffold55_cov237-Pinguiococcus_pyrenoidosus.AAC.6